MAGKFEVFLDSQSKFRFRLVGADGSVMAVSQAFNDKAAVVAGIAAVRECAGTGLVTDLSPAGALTPAVTVAAAPATEPTLDDRAAARLHALASAKVIRRHTAPAHWDWRRSRAELAN
ncbi:protein of unknown function DUF1508 [Pseudarthrobacter chlorophenolicus A6]|uniref:DUF1508 domain-containing protein n=1 Tax=Pseudarthrobacter chlorophenolicus (strain ATCC 700700 / DSM 12829 / CIP 107037 / JCM 12360 / KCTC 9906 / NCIMB 13794 / A6) TaxID=452863 RepID=B8HBV5_PSECP|nr:DUF1508 domain-containing protein [Pseudarthrobacter chlorophenolicus]ACL38665.1 protein of unknown function DUF1508 [Pseudarthrobacter chlorophenolicus A6]SDQ44185.1 hypothetical protein SAMN04489738_0861 [Pseudarthrobacter chlorophenolicus]